MLLKEDWVARVSFDFHGSSWVLNNAHVKFQALHHKFAQSMAQMIENQPYWVKSQLWSTYSQTSRFLDNINNLKKYPVFDQGLIMIP